MAEFHLRHDILLKTLRRRTVQSDRKEVNLLAEGSLDTYSDCHVM